MTIRYDEKGKIFSDVITKEPVAVTLQTPTHRIHGNIYVMPSERPKDALNSEEFFVAVTQATVYDSQGQNLYTVEFMAVHRDQIIWMIPDADIQNAPEEARETDDPA